MRVPGVRRASERFGERWGKKVLEVHMASAHSGEH